MRHFLRKRGSGIAVRIATRLAVAGCTLVAVHLFGLFSGSRAHTAIADGFASASYAVGSMLQMHASVGTALESGLVVAGLAVAGVVA